MTHKEILEEWGVPPGERTLSLGKRWNGFQEKKLVMKKRGIEAAWGRKTQRVF